MGEVLTEVKPEAPTRERWEEACDKYGVVEFSSEFFAAIKDGHRVDHAMPIAIRNIEIKRLERLVIEKAKAYGRAARAVEDHMKKSNEEGSDPGAGWQLLRDMESTQEDLMLEAVWPLIDFESQIKR